MSNEQLLGAYKSYMKCQCSHDKDAKAQEETRPFVTISRQTGAGGTTIGQKLAAYLQEANFKSLCPWTVFDKELVGRVLEEHHLPKEIGKYMPEKKASEIQDMVDTFFELHPPAFALVRDTSETILHLAQMGHVILVGRGSNFVTYKLKAGVHVRLVGSLEKRADHAAEYFKLNVQDAVKKIKDEDKERKGYAREYFDRDIDDPLHYDLVINTDHVSYDAAAKIIGDLVVARKVSKVASA